MRWALLLLMVGCAHTNPPIECFRLEIAERLADLSGPPASAWTEPIADCDLNYCQPLGPASHDKVLWFWADDIDAAIKRAVAVTNEELGVKYR